MSKNSAKPHPLWDVPTRLFHALIVFCLALSWWSAEQQRYDLHEWSGSTVIVLVLTRIVWGFVGSRHSRFTDFVVSPAKALAYLRDHSGAEAANQVGHNPAGGWSVLLLLGLLLLQAVSGLFNSDDVLFSGPLHFVASTDFRGAMGLVHEMAFNGLLALVCLHILAVLYYQFRRRQKLLQPMLFGSVEGREGKAAPVPWWWALTILLILAAALWWGLEQAPQPAPLQW